MREQLVLSGAFSTGKSSLMKMAKETYGDRLHYIEDGSRELIKQFLPNGGGLESLPLDKVVEFQEQMLEYYVKQEGNRPANKITLSDGSLNEVLAYSQGVLSPAVLHFIENMIRYKVRSQMYHVLKLPVGTFDVERDGERHENEAFQRIIDKRITDTWNEYPDLEIVTVQKQIDGVAQRFHYLSRMITNLEKNGSVYDFKRNVLAKSVPHDYYQN